MTPAGDLEAIAKTVPCPDCGADPNMVCVDTDNAFWRCDIHLGRVAASQEVPF